jgi:tRNA threonylcarbamoyl adenosine modification protein (Sua5/YciO/YrdC/YwlC family)
LAQCFAVHPDNPQQRLVTQVAEVIRAGGLVVYPTDSAYALGWSMGDKAAQDRVRILRRLDDHHDFTVVCRDLSEIATYAKVDDRAYRLMRKVTPGPYTFLLKATHEVPRRLQNPRRKTVGIRVPDNRIARAVLEALGEPMMSSTLTLPGEEMPLTDAEEIRDRLGKQVDLIVDGGHCGHEPTTVVDLMGDLPQILRRGKGDPTPFEAG